MSRHLHVSKDLALPPEAVTESIGLLGARGSGKSNGARVLAEEMYAAGLPFVVIDPVGAWWGLRSSRDGKSAGLSITILGGEHGDRAIDERAGASVADLVVTQRPFLIIDLSAFESEGAKKRFLLAFATRLYLKNKEALHLFLEEADDYIPQKMRGGDDERAVEPQLLRAFENIVRRGRSRGLGMTMITQRSAVLNKNVLTQVQTLIAFRTTGPQDRDAIKEWVKYHGQADEILASLASLEDGEAWVWSPDFLRKTVRTRFRLSETYDSGRTPKPGESRRPPTARADIDLSGVDKAMAEAIERAKQDDPKALRAEVAKWKRLAESKPAAAPAKVQRVEVPILKDGQVKRLEAAVERLVQADVALERVAKPILDTMRAILSRPAAPAAAPRVAPPRPSPAPAPRPTVARAPAATPTTNGELGKGERAVLTAIAQHADGLSRENITVLTGYKKSSRDTYLFRLRTAGHVDDGDPIRVTQAGLDALGSDFTPLPTGAALVEHWRRRLSGGELAIFDVLVKAYPAAVDRDAITTETNFKKSSRDTYLYRLRNRHLVADVGRGSVRASDRLFQEGE